MAENESLENKIHDELTSSVKKGKMLKTLTSTVTLDLDLGIDGDDLTKSKIRKQEAEAYLKKIKDYSKAVKVDFKPKVSEKVKEQLIDA